MTLSPPGKTTAPDVPLIKEKLRAVVRAASVSRLNIHTGSKQIETAELEPPFCPGRILGNKLVFILISGDALRLTFKIHFNTGTAKQLAYRIFGGPSFAGISEKQAIDYFKEYGNLVAGRIVTELAKPGIDLGISLPLCTRGFYEVFSDYEEKQSPVIAYSDFWKLKIDSHDIFCSAQFEIMNTALLDRLPEHETDDTEEEDAQEIEFL